MNGAQFGRLAGIDAMCARYGFELDDWSDNGKWLRFSGRGQGNGTDCELDGALVKHALELKALLVARYPELTIAFDHSDEWLILTVTA